MLAHLYSQSPPGVTVDHWAVHWAPLSSRKTNQLINFEFAGLLWLMFSLLVCSWQQQQQQLYHSKHFISPISLQASNLKHQIK